MQGDSEIHLFVIEETNRRLTRLENKVDKLLQFKWQIVGGSVLISVMFTVAIQIASIIFKGGI